MFLFKNIESKDLYGKDNKISMKIFLLFIYKAKAAYFHFWHFLSTFAELVYINYSIFIKMYLI